MPTRRECEDAVARYGKFQGEAVYVPFYWEVYLGGFADDDDGETLTFYVSDPHRAIFPELIGRTQVCLRETDDGFVVEV